MKLKDLKKVIAEELSKLSGKKLITEQNPNQAACAAAGSTYNQQSANQVGQANAAGFPFSGQPGINQNFVNNMQGKPTQFYQARHAAFTNKIISLRNTGTGYCNGDNPFWQAKLTLKSMYVQHCSNNPGTC